jgi:hypothetical protein
MLDQGCPIEFFRVQRSIFYFFKNLHIFECTRYTNFSKRIVLLSCKKFIKDLYT